MEQVEELLSKNLLCSSQGFCKSRRLHCLKDLMETAMGHSSGERGQRNKDCSKSFRCSPASCFECVLCKSHVPSTTTCFEHACEEHPVQMQDLSRDSLIETLVDGKADSIFCICAKLSNSKSMWELHFIHLYKLYMLTCSLCLCTTYALLGHCHEYIYIYSRL